MVKLDGGMGTKDMSNRTIIKVVAIVSVLLLAGCAETAAMLDATANQMCQQNPTPDCYDQGRL